MDRCIQVQMEHGALSRPKHFTVLESENPTSELHKIRLMAGEEASQIVSCLVGGNNHLYPGESSF